MIEFETGISTPTETIYWTLYSGTDLYECRDASVLSRTELYFLIKLNPTNPSNFYVVNIKRSLTNPLEDRVTFQIVGSFHQIHKFR